MAVGLAVGAGAGVGVSVGVAVGTTIDSAVGLVVVSAVGSELLPESIVAVGDVVGGGEVGVSVGVGAGSPPPGLHTTMPITKPTLASKSHPLLRVLYLIVITLLILMRDFLVCLS
jgi:hypothetical protein